MGKIRLIVALVFITLAFGAARGACAPEKMVKIVTRPVGDEIDPRSFAAKPKTMYRLGDRYSRLEETLDAEQGIHGLIITAEPDSWMINLVTKSGQHLLDPGPSFVVHAQVFGGPEDDAFFKSFEFGCELAAVKAKGVRPETSVVDGRKVDTYKVVEGDRTVVLTVASETDRPLSVSLLEKGAPRYRFEYVDYVRDLAPDMTLFKPPAGITITEAPPQSGDVVMEPGAREAPTQGGSAAMSPDELFGRMTTFYRSPSREEFDAIQNAMKQNLEEIEKGEEENGSAMLAAVFLARVHDKYSWPVKEIGPLSKTAREISSGKSSKLGAYVENDARVDASKLDIWWVSYFATGETRYLDRLLAQLGDMEAQKGTEKILVTGAANWSFTSNCRKHPAILQYARSVLARDPAPRNRASIQGVIDAAEKPRAKDDGDR